MQDNAFERDIQKRSQSEKSVIRTFVVLNLIILISYTLILLVFNYVTSELTIIFEVALNVVLLTGIIFPVMYKLVLCPLLGQITERRLAEESLIQSKLDWEYTFNAITDIITIQDSECNIIRANKAAKEMLGLASLQSILPKCYKHYHGTDQPPEDCPAFQSLTSGKPVTMEVFEPHLKMHLEVRSIPRMDNDNNLIGLIHVARDITDRKSVEKALVESEERYRRLIEFSPEAIFVHDGERFIYANEAAAHVVGAKGRDELIGKPILDFVHPEHSELVSAQLRKVIERRRGIPSLEKKIRRLDGTVADMEISSAYVYYEGSPAVQVIMHDVTERKRAENELEVTYTKLKEKKSFIESVISNIQSGIIVTDQEMHIQLANPYVLRLFGKSGQEIIGSGLDHVCPEICSSIAGGTDDDEITVKLHENDLIIGFRRFDLKGADESVIGNIITFVDLSEIIKIRNEIKLKDRLATVGEVVANVAHEMRNPLFGITAVAQILAMELKLTPEQLELMNSLFSEAKRLNNLVKELLDCSKEIRLSKREFDIVKEINESLSINEVFIDKKSLDIIKILPEGKIVILGDPERFKQVMLNILKNAIDATSAEGTIRIEVTYEEEMISIEVKDSGSGIPENVMDKIFDVFYTTKKHGTGLGLSISRKIVEAHGGTLSAANNADGGAAFTVTLPRKGENHESTRH